MAAGRAPVFGAVRIDRAGGGARPLSTPKQTVVEAGGNAVRVWRAGNGPVVGFLAGLGGLTRWTPFLDRLAERRTVVVPSLPGFPGGGTGHLRLDTQLDWLLAVKDLLDASGLAGADMVAGNVAAALLADVAALWPSAVRRMTLIAPHGLYLEQEPSVDLWAQKPGALSTLVCVTDGWAKQRECPAGEDPMEWQIEQNRASEAVARIFWPLGSTDLEKRLGRITAPTQLLRGSRDRVLPASYAEQFRQRLGGDATVQAIEGAGHIAELDRPDEVAEAVLRWFDA